MSADWTTEAQRNLGALLMALGTGDYEGFDNMVGSLSRDELVHMVQLQAELVLMVGVVNGTIAHFTSLLIEGKLLQNGEDAQG